jgi:hypothetical protein
MWAVLPDGGSMSILFLTIFFLIAVILSEMLIIYGLGKACRKAGRQLVAAQNRITHLEGELQRVEKAREARAVVEAESPETIG